MRCECVQACVLIYARVVRGCHVFTYGVGCVCLYEMCSVCVPLMGANYPQFYLNFSLAFVCQIFCFCLLLHVMFFRLQKWKLHLANTVITKDNASLRDMRPDQVLDLFSVASESAGACAKEDEKAGAGEIHVNRGIVWAESN